MKKLPHSIIVGQQGINLIERIVLEMGCVWHPSHLDAGIDGYIEIRNPATGEMTNGIIQVQSKATEQEFESEARNSFEYRCTPRDLEYWLAGNAPVILIRSRPRTDEAYWVSIKDYFKDPTVHKTGRINFDKSRDRFDAKALDSLLRLAVPADSGIYLGTLPRTEKVYSNLLRLSAFPFHYYIAQTQYRTREEVFAVLHETLGDAPGGWILSNKTIRSFHDLSADPWGSVCDQGTVDPIPTTEWSNTCDEDEKRLFVRLLNACLRDKLYPKGVSFSKENGYYYFRATRSTHARISILQPPATDESSCLQRLSEKTRSNENLVLQTLSFLWSVRSLWRFLVPADNADISLHSRWLETFLLQCGTDNRN